VTEPVKTKKEPGSHQKYGVELREQSPPFWHRFAELTGLNLPFGGKFLRDAASKSF
jgi:hypothetical protein